MGFSGTEAHWMREVADRFPKNQPPPPANRQLNEALQPPVRKE
jgi:hypothetical protein